MVNGCSLCKDSEELTDHILIHCDKTRELWTLLFSNIRFGLGVLDFSEKSSPKINTQGAREKEKSSLTIGFDLPILVYLERVQPKDFRR